MPPVSILCQPLRGSDARICRASFGFKKTDGTSHWNVCHTLTRYNGQRGWQAGLMAFDIVFLHCFESQHVRQARCLWWRNDAGLPQYVKGMKSTAPASHLTHFLTVRPISLRLWLLQPLCLKVTTGNISPQGPLVSCAEAFDRVTYSSSRGGVVDVEISIFRNTLGPSYPCWRKSWDWQFHDN